MCLSFEVGCRRRVHAEVRAAWTSSMPSSALRRDFLDYVLLRDVFFRCAPLSALLCGSAEMTDR